MRRAGSAPGLEPEIQNALGRELRHMYEQVVHEPVPDRFIRLLDRLEAETGGQDEGIGDRGDGT